jgi:HD superfamily phosphohydrolase
MKNFEIESLTHDPLHGYIPFTSREGTPPGETSEEDIIDHPWVQRMRQIHQLQTAWYVFPTAEHSRFQHVLGVMHLASLACASLYDSLLEVCPDAPSRGYVESLMRMAGLLHDVGHGPFGHFFDDHFLSHYDLTHEKLGQQIIRHPLGDLLRGIRRNPHSVLGDGEQLDPLHVAALISRPRANQGEALSRWLELLRSLFCGLYTVDNMDFVLRDAYMTGYSTRAFDLQRLLHYTFFSERGLTIHQRGLAALVSFLGVRAELFRAVYFHRTVRAIDLELRDLFADSREYLFPHNPAEKLDEYLRFTESSLLVDVVRWHESDDPAKQELGRRWQSFMRRELFWHMACERTLFFDPEEAERSTIFSSETYVEDALRRELPAELNGLPLKVDIARHVHRPGTRGPVAGQNFLYESATKRIRDLNDHELMRRIPVSFRICRVYAESAVHDQPLAAALNRLLHPGGEDDLTNM